MQDKNEDELNLIRAKVKNLVEKKRFSNDFFEQKVFFSFGLFLEKIDKNEKSFFRSLTLEGYRKNEIKIDRFFKDLYLMYLGNQNLSESNKNDYIQILDFNHFNTGTEYKFYFLRHFMWNFIPLDFLNKFGIETNIKYQELPKFVQKIPLSYQLAFLFNTGSKVKSFLGKTNDAK